MQTIALTGANGVLGTAISKEAVRAGFGVRKLSRDDDWAAADECDFLIHAAGKAVSETEQNVSLAQRVAKAARSVHVLNLSSVSVYGPTPEKVITETAPCKPITQYGKDKLASEQVMDAALGPRVTHLRITNVYQKALGLPKLSKVSMVLKGNEYSSLISDADVADACMFLIGINPPGGPLNVSRADLGALQYRSLYTSMALSVPVLVPHLLRVVKGQKSIPADRLFSNRRLLDLGWKPSATL